MPLTESQNIVKKLLEESLSITPEDRQFWLENLEKLPSPTVENLKKVLITSSQKINYFLGQALENDTQKSYIKKLRLEFNQIQKQAFSIEEAQQNSKSELTDLENALKQA